MHTTASAPEKIVGIADQLLNGFEAAEFVRNSLGIPITESDLERHARAGNGPIFRKWGKQRLYRKADAVAWAANRLSAPIHPHRREASR